MEITVSQIYDYLNCPLKYYFRNVAKLEEPESKNDLFKRYIHKTIFFFYYSVMGGMVPSSKQMKDKWANLWKEAQQKPDITEFLLKERRPNLPQLPRKEADRYHLVGFEMIHHFHLRNKDNPGIPIAVDHEFRVPISGVKVTGKFELIRESIDNQTSSRFIEIVDFKANMTDPDPFLVKHDLGLSMMAYAFRNLFQATEDRMVYSHLKSGQDYYVHLSDSDMKRMVVTVEGVAEGITRKKFYPRQGIQCKTCPFRFACDRINL